MSRDLPAGLVTAIDAPVVRPFLAVRIELPDPVYAWTGQGTIVFNDSGGVSRNWIGAGGISAIDAVGEATDGSATGIRVALFNVPSEFRANIADQAVRGALFEVYTGALNETFQTVDANALVWKGKLDDYRITDGGDTLSVEIVGESRAIDQRRPSIKRFTHEYQTRKYPGDLFFQYVSKMTEVSILWGKAEPKSGGSSSGIGGGGGANTSGGGADSF